MTLKKIKSICHPELRTKRCYPEQRSCEGSPEHASAIRQGILRRCAPQDDSVLYIVATPIGNLADISARAIEILSSVDLIACEDTRHSRVLLNYLGIQKSLIALHEHNEEKQAAVLVEKLCAGTSVALISDAGTPLVNDPGYRVVNAAAAANVRVVPVPGACAAIAALSVSGLPTDAFIFCGYFPAKRAERRACLEKMKNDPRTQIFYETPHRLMDCMEDSVTVLGEDRRTVIARELTKTFETVYRGTTKTLHDHLSAHPDECKGECVILFGGASTTPTAKVEVDALEVLNILLRDLPLKQAVALTAEITDAPKNKLYEEAIRRRR